MKKQLMRCLSLLLCAVLLSVPALAAEPAAEEPARQGPARVWGTVTWLDNGGLLVKNSNESDPLHEVVLHGESIICLDAVTGESMELEQIKDGDTIYAWVGPAMTMSLPPQVTAQMIVANIPADYGVPQYYEIASVTPQAMIAIYPPPALTWTEVTATDGTTLRITDEAAVRNERIATFDAAAYTSRTFSMFGGETTPATLLVEESVMSAIIDRFGKDVESAPVDATHARVHVTVAASPVFFGWLAQFGTAVRLEAPSALSRQYADYLRGIADSY